MSYLKLAGVIFSGINFILGPLSIGLTKSKEEELKKLEKELKDLEAALANIGIDLNSMVDFFSAVGE
jgi:hypothetical protein